MAFFGYLTPGQTARIVGTNYGDQTPLLVAYSFRDDGLVSRTWTSYILLPSVTADPKIVTVQEEDGRFVAIHESVNFFYSLLLWYSASIIGTWWFWFRKRKY